MGPMNDTAASSQTAGDRYWPRALARYRDPILSRSLIEIGVTAFPLAALWATMWATQLIGHWWLTLLLALPAAGFLVRLFIIQHDCSHGAFFGRRGANDWVGRVIGVFTLTPHDYWRRTHAIHHASTGNLEQRGIGDVATLTVDEYLALGRWRRLAYRVYRHPVFMFGVAPAYLFIVQHRLPLGLMRKGWEPWVSTMATNAAIVAVFGGLAWLVGIKAFLLIQVPVALGAATIGVWLFYVQHQFENTLWEHEDNWSHQQASLRGSSHYDLPAALRWITGNIGIHHVHHLSSRIPYYRLPQVLRDHPELIDTGRLTLAQSFACVRLVLWDEARRRLVSFRDMRRNAARSRVD